MMVSSTPKRIAILVTDDITEARRAAFGDIHEWFTTLLEPLNGAFSYQDFQTWRGELPGSPDDFDGYIITGSKADAHAKDRWILELAAFSIAAAARRPVVGICFGHQLLHHHMGGRSGRATAGWGAGIHKHHLDMSKGKSRAAWMRPSADSLELVVFHQDQVSEPAVNSQVLGGSSFCPVAISTVGENVLTFQGHPEFSPAMCAHLVDDRRHKLGPDVSQSALESLKRATDHIVAGHWIVNFLAR